MFSSASKMYIKPVVNAVCGDLSNACVELFGISTSDVIKEIWINDVKKIDTDATLDVVFTRPDPRASFCYRSNSDSSSCDSDTISSIKIVISNGLTLDKEKTRNISIQNTGQISMQ